MRRRYYVTSLDVFLDQRDLFNNMVGAHALHLYDPADPDAIAKWEAAGKPVLVSTTFRLEVHADRWHAHPEVAILPDYFEEGKDTLKSHLDKPTRKLKQQHLDHLAKIGFSDKDTVLDLEQKAIARNPCMKLRSVL